MKKLLVGVAALPFLAGVAMAGQPAPLSDTQMDRVTAGFEDAFLFLGLNNVVVVIGNPVLTIPPGTNFIAEIFPTLDGTPLPGFPRVVGGNL